MNNEPRGQRDYQVMTGDFYIIIQLMIIDVPRVVQHEWKVESLWADSRSAVQLFPVVESENRDVLVTWESLSVTEQTISVCDNHTKQWGFIKSTTGCPSLEPTSVWLHDDWNRFFTFLFSNTKKRRRQVQSKSEILLFKSIGDGYWWLSQKPEWINTDSFSKTTFVASFPTAVPLY